MAKNKKHILVVDDVTTNLHCVGEVLKEKYILSMAKSAEQAFKILEKNVPHMIILDIKMPGMDGFEFLEKIRGDIRFATVPVIFLTADKQEEYESKCLRMGASDFIRKPFSADVMLSRIERILEQEAKNEEIRLMAMKDTLTGLWNRKYLEEMMQKFTAGKIKGTLMLLDLDNFKGINDTYGHVMGDAALIAFGRTLSRFVHSDDVVARIGGDEFAVFLKNAVGEELLSNRVAGLVKDVEKELGVIRIKDASSSVSIGISAMPKDGNTFIELYNNADKALYYVKRNGKNHFRFYTGEEKVLLETDGDSDVIDLSDLRPLISERELPDGPYNVEYNSFTSIYRFLRRYVARTGSKVQFLLFTLKDLSLSEPDEKDIKEAMATLEKAISKSLRKNDVSSQYTDNQYLVIMMDLAEENRIMVLERIISAWTKSNKNKNMLLKYNIEELLDDENETSLEGMVN